MIGRRRLGLALVAVVLGAASAWSFAAGDDSPPAGAPAGPAGADLFLAKGCAGCHVGPGGGGGGNGPDLDRLTASPEYVARAITDPGADVGPGYGAPGFAAMPQLDVSPEELDLLVGHLLER